MSTNPFYAGTYGGEELQYTSAAERLERVKTFSLVQCVAAKRMRRLQKTVRRALIARINRLTNKVAAYEKQMKKMKRNGLCAYAGYPCPQCEYELHAAVPSRGHKYDSMVECPACEWLHFKEVNHHGRVTISIQEGAA